MVTDLVPQLPSDRALAARSDFISQTTAVEQARAVAEVQAQVIVAQQCQRMVASAVADMRESCSQMGLAERAFYKFPRAGQSVSGPSIHLARELARCWGNIQYDIQEMRRDEVGHYSEMRAWAWDVQTNTRSGQTFVVPHKRDKKGGPETLVDLRDIYENNANMAARRLREAIFSVLPTWFTEEAKALCTATLENPKGDNRTLAQRIADAIKRFDALGVKIDRLEGKLGPSSEWTVQDVAQLAVSYTSIRQGTVSTDDEFPPIRTTGDDVAAQAGTGKGRGKVSVTPADQVAPDAAAPEAGAGSDGGPDDAGGTSSGPADQPELGAS